MTAIESAGAFFPKAHEIVEDLVLGWNLGNSLDAFSDSGHDKLSSEILWGNPKTTKDMIGVVAEAGFSAVRVPVTWGNHADEHDVIDPAWLRRVREVVEMVLDCGLYCVLDLHHDTGEKGWLRASVTGYPVQRERFCGFWRQIAGAFSDCDGHLILESFNELLDDQDGWVMADPKDLAIANALNQDFVDTIRSLGGNHEQRCLMVTPYAARFEPHMIAPFTMPQDVQEDKIIVDVHAYVPYLFAQNSSEEWTEADIDETMRSLKEKFLDHGMPLIIGEFGAFRKRNEIQRLDWTAYYVRSARALGVPCFWWDSGAQDFILLDRRSLCWFHPHLLGTLTAAARGEDYIVPVSEVPGDADLDGVLTEEDIALVQRYLLGQETLRAEQLCNADLDKDGAVTAMDLAMMKRLLEEERRRPVDLIRDSSQWYLYTGDGEGAIYYSGADAIHVVTEKLGSTCYEMQAIYKNLELKAGKSYTLTYRLFSDAAGVMQACIQEDGGGYQTFAHAKTNTSPEPVACTVRFCPEEDCAKARINFNCGFAEGSYHITDISLMCETLEETE